MNVMLVTEACLALPGEMSLLWCLWQRVSETSEVRRLLLSSLTITARWDYPGNSSPHHQFISLVNKQSILFLSSHWTGWSIDEACLHAGPSQSTHPVNLHTHSRGQNFTALPLYPTSVNRVVSNYITHMNLKKQKTWFNNL